MDNGYLFTVFVFLAVSCVVVPIASRFRLGAVLGYLFAGILIGPFGTGLIGNAEQIMHIAEFGVVMMLFMIGLELEPQTLWRLRKTIIGSGGMQTVLTSLMFAAIGVALGFSLQASLAAGMALSLSSTALALQLLEEKNLLHTSTGEASFAILLFQDIAVIPILILFPLLAVEGGVSTDFQKAHFLTEYPGWVHALAVMAIIGGVVLAGRYLSHHLFSAIARTNLREVFTATSLALVVGITLLMQTVGVSPALGAFIAGVVLANSEYKRTLETDIEPFKGLLLGLFFISVGMGMDFSLLAEQPFTLFGVLSALLCVKILLLFIISRFSGLTAAHGIGLSLFLSQGGEFAFVLFAYADSLNILSRKQVDILTLAVALSMMVTPLLALVYSRYIVPRFMSVLPEREFDAITEESPIILAGYGRFGQIIGRFLRAQGMTLTILENNPEQIDLLRKFGFKGYFGDASRLDLLKSAGAGKARLLIVAVDDADACLEIVRLAKAHFPNLAVFARARNRRHAYELHKAGVDYFRRETFDSSLSMAQEVMKFLGHNTEEIRKNAAVFLRHDEETLMRSFDFFEHEPELISFARQASGELERILQNDQKTKS